MTKSTTIPARQRVFIDSSAYLALVSRRDDRYAEARRLWDEVIVRYGWPTYTSNYIVAESHALFVACLGRDPAEAFLRQFATSATVVLRVGEDDEQDAAAIIYRYRDKTFSLTDATSFVLMTRYDISLHLRLTMISASMECRC